MRASIGVAGDADGFLGSRQRLAGGDAQLPFHQVEAGDHFGHRVFDLQPGVHLQEEEAGFVRDEFHRAGADIADRARRGDGGLAHGVAAIIVEAGRGRFLDHLLVAALHRAVALEQMHDVAVRVGEDLHLDVARPCQIALDQHAVVAERRGGFLLRRGEGGGKFAGRCDDAHAAAAAAGDRLDQHGKADARCLVGEERVVLPVAVIAGQQRHAGAFHQRLGGGLGAHGAHRRRRRADEDDARRGAGFGEGGVLREEAVAGMDRLGAARARGGDDASGC